MLKVTWLIARTLLVLAMSLGAAACQPAGHVDLIGGSIERAAERLRLNRGSESEVEIYSGESGPWTVVVVPLTGVDFDALARLRVDEKVIDRLKAESPKLRDGQYIIQVRKDVVLGRPVDIDLVRIEKQFVLTGSETTRVVAKLKGTGAGHEGKSYLADIFTREP